MKKIYLFLVLVVLALNSCDNAFLEDRSDDDNNTQTTLNDDGVVPGRLLVKLTPAAAKRFTPSVTKSGGTATSIAKLDEVSLEMGIVSIERVFPDGGRFSERRRAAGLHLWYEIVFDETKSVTKSVSRLNSEDFEFVEPITEVERIGGNEIIPLNQEEAAKIVKSKTVKSTTTLPNDPYLSFQWHYHNEGITYNSRPGADINLYQAWEIEKGKKEVIVAIIDGGIQYDHPDLAANMWINTAEIDGNSLDDDGNGFVDDVYGYNFVDMKGQIIPHAHGTHVAGTVAAVNNNGIGVAGVAGGDGTSGSGVRLMSCQIFRTNPSTGADVSATNRNIARALVYATDNGAVIAQNSWGSSGTYLDPSIKEAIDYFINNAGLDEDGQQEGPMKGGVVIFAAGNNANSTMYMPPAYEKVMAVSAFAPNLSKAWYSCYGSWVDIAAPGGDEYYNVEGLVLSTMINGGYGYEQGTSMAAPHVSGIAALVVSKYGVGHPGFTNTDLKNRLLSSTNNISPYTPYPMGVGYINAQKALSDYGKKAPDRVTNLRGDWDFSSVKVSWTITADADNGKADRYELLYSTTNLFGMDFENYPQGVSKIHFKAAGNIGDTISMIFGGVPEGVTYYFSVKGFDSDGNSSMPTTIYGQIKQNQPPVIDGIPRNIVLRNNEVREVSLNVYDPEGYAWSYEFDGGSSALTYEVRSGSFVLKFNTLNANPGSYVAKLTIRDEQELKTSVEILYIIQGNTSPVLIKSFDKEIILNGTGVKKTIDLRSYFKDADGDPLTYKVEFSNPSVAIATQTSPGIFDITSIAVGTSNVNISALDSRNAKASGNFTLICRDASRPVDLFPIPVKDGVLNVRMADFLGTVEVSLYTMSGSRVYNETMRSVPLQTMPLDISKLKAGNYQVVVKYINKEYKQTITKL